MGGAGDGRGYIEVNNLLPGAGYLGAAGGLKTDASLCKCRILKLVNMNGRTVT